MQLAKILSSVELYYNKCLEVHGATARGVDWNSSASQVLRFEQLLKVCDLALPFSVIDYGCGYGALVDYLINRDLSFRYQGFDISQTMIATARTLQQYPSFVEFYSDVSSLNTADYTVASGIFNIKLDTSDADWLDYILHTLSSINSLNTQGFSFNILTRYADIDFMRSHLYYADPCFLFDYCKTRFSRHVSLLHDYGLYEFTILVRK